jgi:hypothetical protein
MESPGEAFIRDIPGLGETGDNIVVLVKLAKAFKCMNDHVRAVNRRVEGWVDRLGRRADLNVENVGGFSRRHAFGCAFGCGLRGCLSARSAARSEEERARHNSSQDDRKFPLHFQFSFVFLRKVFRIS